jgi:hypothetical protein
LLFRKSAREKNSTSGYMKRATVCSLCLMDVGSDVCRDQNAALTRAMWTTTAADAWLVPFHGKC